ncbi:MAG: hypothetical protein U5K56_02225 [Halioglobus sp.]|nr:hypothetical protein [Halioglobus sp.]
MVRVVAASLILLLLCGCKVAVVVVEGGEVLFGDDVGSPETCTGGSICFLEVTESSGWIGFHARPDEGWEFVRWQSGDGFLCQDSNRALCEIPLDSLAGLKGSGGDSCSGKDRLRHAGFSKDTPDDSGKWKRVVPADILHRAILE